MDRVSRRAFLKYGGLGAISVSAGCSPGRSGSRDFGRVTTTRTYGYHPFENDIPSKGHSMTYLVMGSGGGVLVDPGRGTAHDEVVAFIRSHGLDPEAVGWAVLTHCHVDHTGGARLIQGEGIPVACSAFTAKAVREASVDMGFKTGSQPESSCEVDRILKDGDVLESGGVRMQTIATPGHTAGCSSFLVETNEGRTVFTGDLIRNTGQPGWTGSPSFSLEQSIESIEKLLALAPDKAYWGHGEVEGPAQAWLEMTLDLYKRGKWSMD